MGQWEEGHLNTADCPFHDALVWYGRYIDNFLLIWQAGTDLFPDFFSFIKKKLLTLSLPWTLRQCPLIFWIPTCTQITTG